MYSENINNINKKLEDYFSEVIYSWNDIEFSIASNQITHYLLSSLLIQMCGFVEQKYDTILWEIGYLTPSLRYKLDEYKTGSIDLKKYQKLYNDENWYIAKTKNFNSKLACEYNNVYEKTNTINILIDSTAGAELEYFKTYMKSKVIENDIQSMVKQVTDKRNETAHFKQFYNSKNICSLHQHSLSIIDIPFNYLTGYILLLALDKALINLFNHINIEFISKQS